MVEIKLKNLDRREWYSDTDRDFSCMYREDDFFEGGIGLITFTGLKAPDEVDSPSGKLCIADKGYQWVELAPKNGNYVITSMFHDDKIFQHYIDITLKNKVSDDGNAVFYDLLLDIVCSENGDLNIVDSEELEEALSAGVVSQEEYNLAKDTAEEVISLFRTNKELLEKKLFEYRELLA